MPVSERRYPAAGLHPPVVRELRRTAAALVWAAVLVFTVGCASAPPAREIDAPPPLGPALDGERQGFLQRVEQDSAFSRETAPALLVFLDQQEALSRVLPDQRLVDRVDHLLFLVDRQGNPTAWVSGRFPPFWTGRALARQGWERQGPRRWADASGQAVSIMDRNFLRLDAVAVEVPVPRQPPEVTVEAVLAMPWRSGAELVWVAHPRLPGDLAFLDTTALAPQSVLVMLDAREVLGVVAFSGEREARVALVGLRLMIRPFLQEQGFAVLPSFALERRDTALYLEGVEGQTEQMMRFLVQPAARGEDADDRHSH